MDDSQQFRRRIFDGYGYHSIPVQIPSDCLSECNRVTVPSAIHRDSQFNEGKSVIKQTFLQIPGEQHRQVNAHLPCQNGDKCAQSPPNYCNSSTECLGMHSANSVPQVQERNRDADRTVITPDSTDMVNPPEVNPPGSDGVKLDTTSPEKKDNSEAKPPMSYIGLISKAILQSQDRRMNLGAIYSWMEGNFSYFRQNSRGWRNSVRHNLSLNDCFIKAGRCEDGKGNYWTIHPENLDDFIRGDFRLRRRSRRRGKKGESNRSEGLAKGAYQSPSHPPGAQMYIPQTMPPQVPFSSGQQYILQDASASYPPSYNPAYAVYESSPPSHAQSLPPYNPWTHQSSEQCVDLLVQPPTHNYGHNPPHLYSYTNYSYPSYGYQTTQW